MKENIGSVFGQKQVVVTSYLEIFSWTLVLMSIIPAMWEAAIRRVKVQGLPRANSSRDTILKKPNTHTHTHTQNRKTGLA
jgi:hypothetical protein